MFMTFIIIYNGIFSNLNSTKECAFQTGAQSFIKHVFASLNIYVYSLSTLSWTIKINIKYTSVTNYLKVNDKFLYHVL